MVFSKATAYRQCNPLVVKNIWDVLENIRAQKQSITMSKLVRAVSKACDITDDEASQKLIDCELDGLIIKVNSKGGSDSYQLPDFTRPCHRLGHDWYCYVCHGPGEVIKCTDCFRVYHKDCAKEESTKRGTSSLSDDEDDFVCHVCQARPKCEYSRKQIRKLLDFATHHLRKQESWRTLSKLWSSAEELCKLDYLIYHYIDLDLITKKMKDGRYTALEELLLDCGLLVHAVCLYWGAYSTQAVLGRVLHREIETEIKEVALCTDCYINAKARVADWISKPCKPSHEVIWAQQKDSSAPQYFWPSKVLLERDSGYEVRFFGGTHARAFVHKSDTRPFHLPADEVGVRRGGGFERAWNEVNKLQANIDIGYYTHSSGESDLPPTDDEYSDDLYLRPLKLQAITSQQAKIASHGSSSLISTGLARRISHNSNDKKKSKKSKSSSQSNRRDSSSLWDTESSHCSPSPTSKSSSKRNAAASRKRQNSHRSTGLSAADKAWEAATLTPPVPAFSSSLSVKTNFSPSKTSASGGGGIGGSKSSIGGGIKRSLSDSDDDSGSDSGEGSWGYTNTAKKSKNAKKGNSTTKPPPKKKTTNAKVNNGLPTRGRGKAGLKPEKQDLSSTDSSEDEFDDDDDPTEDDDEDVTAKSTAKKSSSNKANNKRNSTKTSLFGGRSSGAGTRNTGGMLSSLSNRRSSRSNAAAANISSEDSGDATDYCCQEDYVPPRFPTGMLRSPDVYDHLNNRHPYVSPFSLANLPKKTVDKSFQVSIAPAVPKPVPCNCRERYEKQLEETRKHDRTELERIHKEAQDRLRQDLEAEKQQELQKMEEKLKEAVDREKSLLKETIDREQLRHQEQMEEVVANTKRRQWCRNCLKEAIYHCCWNTSYCSIQCQQEHWQKEHKRVCRRKR